MQIDYDKLTQSLEIFGKAMGVRICILDESGKDVCSFGEICRYCEIIQAEPQMQKKCMASHISTGIQAAKLGDCNFYVCHGNMVHLSVALMPDSSIQAMQKHRKKDVQQQMIGLTMQNLGEGGGNRML